MGVNVFWDDEAKTIIRLVIESHNWTWGELVAGRRQGDALAASMLHKVGVIMEEPRTIPSEIFKADFSQYNESPSNVMVIVIVANLPVVRAIVSLIMKASSRAATMMVMVRTLEEARATVNQRLTKSRSFTSV